MVLPFHAEISQNKLATLKSKKKYIHATGMNISIFYFDSKLLEIW